MNSLTSHTNTMTHTLSSLPHTLTHTHTHCTQSFTHTHWHTLLIPTHTYTHSHTHLHSLTRTLAPPTHPPTHTHISTQSLTHTNWHTRSRTTTHSYTHSPITHTQTHSHTVTHTQTHILTHKHTHSHHTHTHIHTHSHHAHTHTNTHLLTHVHILPTTHTLTHSHAQTHSLSHTHMHTPATTKKNIIKRLVSKNENKGLLLGQRLLCYLYLQRTTETTTLLKETRLACSSFWPNTYIDQHWIHCTCISQRENGRRRRESIKKRNIVLRVLGRCKNAQKGQKCEVKCSQLTEIDRFAGKLDLSSTKSQNIVSSAYSVVTAHLDSTLPKQGQFSLGASAVKIVVKWPCTLVTHGAYRWLAEMLECIFKLPK
jgi:hypothetical protein